MLLELFYRDFSIQLQRYGRIVYISMLLSSILRAFGATEEALAVDDFSSHFKLVTAAHFFDFFIQIDPIIIDPKRRSPSLLRIQGPLRFSGFLRAI